jgi:hypothetical protein
MTCALISASPVYADFVASPEAVPRGPLIILEATQPNGLLVTKGWPRGLDPNAAQKGLSPMVMKKFKPYSLPVVYSPRAMRTGPATTMKCRLARATNTFRITVRMAKAVTVESNGQRSRPYDAFYDMGYPVTFLDPKVNAQCGPNARGRFKYDPGIK